MDEPMKGSCQCGQVHYEADAPPVLSLACHCLDCQKLSGTAFSVTLVFKEENFHIDGDLARYEAKADSGSTKIGYFCPTCGNRIYHTDPAMPGSIRLKPGTLDNAPLTEPQTHVWTSRKQPWVEIPDDVPSFSHNAENLGQALKAYAKRRT